ncbi:hypothetical protein OF83DRAFT_638983 [Amylostereum chailletii]|nr:hypothetical protein OF83DRAFT_638983 [Amylostereum chailletii]
MVRRVPPRLLFPVFLFVRAKDDNLDNNECPTSKQSTTSTVSPTSASSISVPLPTSGPPSLSLRFDQPTNTTTCANTRISWTLNGEQSVPLTIQITDAFASQALFKPGKFSLTVTYRTLTTDVPSTASQLDWRPIDVNEGEYTVVAFDTNRSIGLYCRITTYAQSPSFVVSAGNTSCLDDVSSPSTTLPPVGSSSKPLSAGALIGIVVGLGVGVILIAVAFMLPGYVRHHLPTRRQRRAGGPYYLF